jgi:hypothetical protein
MEVQGMGKQEEDVLKKYYCETPNKDDLFAVLILTTATVELYDYILGRESAHPDCMHWSSALWKLASKAARQYPDHFRSHKKLGEAIRATAKLCACRILVQQPLLIGEQLVEVMDRLEYDRSLEDDEVLVILASYFGDSAYASNLLKRHAWTIPFVPYYLLALDCLQEVPILLLQAGDVALVVQALRMGKKGEDLLRRLASQSAGHRDALVLVWPSKMKEVLAVRTLRSNSSPPLPCTSYECPITLEPCVDPVVASDGHTYERDALMNLFMHAPCAHAAGPLPVIRSPMTRQRLLVMAYPNSDLSSICPWG